MCILVKFIWYGLYRRTQLSSLLQAKGVRYDRLRRGVGVPHPVLDAEFPCFIARTGNLTGARSAALITLGVTNNYGLASQMFAIKESCRNEERVEVAMHDDLLVSVIASLFFAFL